MVDSLVPLLEPVLVGLHHQVPVTLLHYSGNQLGGKGAPFSMVLLKACWTSLVSLSTSVNKTTLNSLFPSVFIW